VFSAASNSGGSSLGFILLIVVLGGGYLLFIRSIQRKQRNQQNSQQQMRDSLTIGTEIVTIGGLYGTVVDVDEESVTLEISDGVTARYDRNAVARFLTPAEDTADDAVDDDDDATEDTASDADETTAVDETPDAPAHASGEKKD